jgi:hypothetical protein
MALPRTIPPTQYQQRALSAAWYLSNYATPDEAMAAMKAGNRDLTRGQVATAFARQGRAADLAATVERQLASGQEVAIGRSGIAVANVQINPDEWVQVRYAYSSSDTAQSIQQGLGNDLQQLYNAVGDTLGDISPSFQGEVVLQGLYSI